MIPKATLFASALFFLGSARALSIFNVDGRLTELDLLSMIDEGADTVKDFPLNFTLKLQVFEKDAPEHVREVDLALTWDLRTRFVPEFVPGEEDYRLSTCVQATAINGGEGLENTFWMKAIQQSIIGEPQDGKEPLQAINRVIAQPEAGCSTSTAGVCMESIGSTEPDAIDDLTDVLFGDSTRPDRPDWVPHDAFPAKAIMISGPTFEEINAYKSGK